MSEIQNSNFAKIWEWDNFQALKIIRINFSSLDIHLLRNYLFDRLQWDCLFLCFALLFFNINFRLLSLFLYFHWNLVFYLCVLLLFRIGFFIKKTIYFFIFVLFNIFMFNCQRFVGLLKEFQYIWFFSSKSLEPSIC